MAAARALTNELRNEFLASAPLPPPLDWHEEAVGPLELVEFPMPSVAEGAPLLRAASVRELFVSRHVVSSAVRQVEPHCPGPLVHDVAPTRPKPSKVFCLAQTPSRGRSGSGPFPEKVKFEKFKLKYVKKRKSTHKAADRLSPEGIKMIPWGPCMGIHVNFFFGCFKIKLWKLDL